MARTPKVTQRVPGPAVRGAPRALVFVDAAVRDSYYAELDAIDRRFPHFSEPPEGMSTSEHWDNLAEMRRYARAELRQSIRIAARTPGCGGLYPIPV